MMKLMTSFGKSMTFGVIVLLIAVAGLFVWFSNPERNMQKEIAEMTAENEGVVARATEALQSVANTANELSGITSGAVLNFEVSDADSRSANFGIVQYDGVRGERIVEEHVVAFREAGSPGNNTAEVDRATNKVVAMHRSVPEFAKAGDPYPVEQLEATAREFVKRVYPNFSESTLAFEPTDKTAQEKTTNYFFRWNDKQFAVPDGLDMDIPPFIQVGINARGFIFSYDNTVQLYRNLPHEALRKLCKFVEMPRTDDSSIHPREKIVKVWFYNNNDPDHARFLTLPYEPETDFEGCSESAKEFLRHLPNPYNKQ